MVKSQKVKDYEEDFYDKHGYIHCELCHRSQSFAFSVHHICPKSAFPKHLEIDNVSNLILVCADCHKALHSDKQLNIKLKQERQLYELFED